MIHKPNTPLRSSFIYTCMLSSRHTLLQHSHVQNWSPVFDRPPSSMLRKFQFSVVSEMIPSVLWRCWLGGRKGIRPVKNWVEGCWRGYLSAARCRLAYHLTQLMPLPLTVSCFSKIQIGFTFLVWLTQVIPEKRAVKRVCVCVRACVHACVCVSDLIQWYVLPGRYFQLKCWKRS